VLKLDSFAKIQKLNEIFSYSRGSMQERLGLQEVVYSKPRSVISSKKGFLCFPEVSINRRNWGAFSSI